ncbi:MAG: hypothetical protein F6J93_17950 [Oscillatoria sp. SIO1A7]|nr:hypothetical protein [Oscillatoria sp. SIO1A7]
MDDWVVLAPTRWKLRRAIRVVNRVLAELRGEMGRDGERWGEMGRDGERWGEMGRDGERWGENFV